MKLNLLLIIFVIVTSITSCKKHDMCCKVTAFDNLNKNTFIKEDCQSNMSNKEKDQFKYNNKALQSKDAIKALPSRYENIQYSCQ